MESMIKHTAADYERTARAILARMPTPPPEIGPEPSREAMRQAAYLNNAMTLMVRLGKRVPSRAAAGGAARPAHYLATYQLLIGDVSLAASLAAVAEQLYKQEKCPTETGESNAAMMATFL